MTKKRGGKDGGGKEAITPEQWDTFFMMLAETGMVLKSCGAAKIASSTMRYRRAQDETIQQRFDEAMERFHETIEGEIQKRAIKGVQKAVFYKGERCDDGEVFEPSDRLLELLAKRHMAAYREKGADINVASGGVLVVNDTPEKTTDWLKKHRNQDGEKS